MASMTSSTGSISPMTSPMTESDGAKVWVEPQQQLSAYMAWVNSQLKKKTGTHLIEDLRNDMRDGVVFADIIEIVAGQKIQGIHNVPATYEEMRSNVDMVLQFMTCNRIRMHRIGSRDIVEGNLKAIMRAILALAAHYKPTSVRHSATSSSHVDVVQYQGQSVIDIAQGASAALTEARRCAKKAGKRYPKSRHSSRYQESSSEPCSDSDQNYLRPDWRMSQGPLHERQELEGCSAGSSPGSPCWTNVRNRIQFSDDDSAASEQKGKSADESGTGYNLDTELQDVKDVKKQLLQLQDLLLTDSPDSAIDTSFEACTPDGAVMLKSQLQHTQMVSEELREELSRIRNECLQLQGTKAGLLQRLSEHDSLLSQLKTDKLNLEIELQTVAAENVSLRKERQDQMSALKTELGQEIRTRDQTIINLRHELMRRDQMLDKLREEAKRQSVTGTDIKRQHAHLKNQKPPPPKAPSRQDKRMSELGDSNHETDSPNCNTSQMYKSMAAEVSFFQDSLQDMQSMLLAPTAQPPLDKLEKSIICLLQNIRASRHPGHLDGTKTSLFNQELADSRKLDNRGSVPKLKQSVVHSSRRGGKPGAGGQAGDGPSTSVIYFTDHSIQPSSCLVPGKLGEIKLRNFKNLFEESERYRYYFKALDPEYGTVKEELTKDDAVVPGWEDKIVAWVETESGTPC